MKPIQYFFRWLAVFAFITHTLNLTCQDTISVFFESNSYKLNDNSKKAIFGVVKSYPAAQIDSIVCIGYADSVGNVNSNFNLSHKRAKSVQKRLLGYRQFNQVLIKTKALGEHVKFDKKDLKRVDIVMFDAVTEIENYR